MAAASCRVSENGEQWLFTKEALARAREAARERAVQVLAERRLGLRVDPPRPLGLSEGLRLVVFYAQKLPELCNLCNAPSEVRWTAVVFFRRFFAMSSPMEFDPAPMMFASVHVACKIEEVKEITLDRLLEAGGFADDHAMKEKVSDLELDLLEGVGFALLVEPKPCSALQMLAEELQDFVRQSPAAAPLPSEGSWPELLARAESMVFDLCVRTDAILHWPASVIIATALGAALDEGEDQVPASDGTPGQPRSAVMRSMLAASVEAEAEKSALSSMTQEVLRALAQLGSEQDVDKEGVQETAKVARKCHRAFERLREERKERHEAHRKERKRRRNEMKVVARRGVPTPMLNDNHLADLKQKAKALQGHEEAAASAASAAASASDAGPSGDTEEFVIHRPKDDMEDD